MLTTYIVAALFIALSAGLSYTLSCAFWKTQYSREDTSGDFGTPRGGFLSTMGGAVISFALVAWLGKYLLAPAALGYVMIAVLIVGAIAGFVPLFRKATKK